MEFEVRFRAAAQDDLDRLYEYVAKESGTERALGFLARIVEACSRLRHFPHRGTQHDHLRPGLRTMGFERRVTIAFIVHDDERLVRIVGVFYRGRDVEVDLRERRGRSW